MKDSKWIRRSGTPARAQAGGKPAREGLGAARKLAATKVGHELTERLAVERDPLPRPDELDEAAAAPVHGVRDIGAQHEVLRRRGAEHHDEVRVAGQLLQ